METLRHVTALEHLLGSLAPQITAMMSRALTLENKRKNTSNLMLEDSNAAGILELTKEKLAGQIVAGKLYSLVFSHHFASLALIFAVQNQNYFFFSNFSLDKKSNNESDKNMATTSDDSKYW